MRSKLIPLTSRERTALFQLLEAGPLYLNDRGRKTWLGDPGAPAPRGLRQNTIASLVGHGLAKWKDGRTPIEQTYLNIHGYWFITQKGKRLLSAITADRRFRNSQADHSR